MIKAISLAMVVLAAGVFGGFMMPASDSTAATAVTAVSCPCGECAPECGCCTDDVCTCEGCDCTACQTDSCAAAACTDKAACQAQDCDGPEACQTKPACCATVDAA